MFVAFSDVVVLLPIFLGFRPVGLHPRLYRSVAVGDKNRECIAASRDMTAKHKKGGIIAASFVTFHCKLFAI